MITKRTGEVIVGVNGGKLADKLIGLTDDEQLMMVLQMKLTEQMIDSELYKVYVIMALQGLTIISLAGKVFGWY